MPKPKPRCFKDGAVLAEVERGWFLCPVCRTLYKGVGEDDGDEFLELFMDEIRAKQRASKATTASKGRKRKGKGIPWTPWYQRSYET